MSNQLDGVRIAFMTANEGVEQVELTEPWTAIEKAGGEPTLIAPERGQVQAFHHLTLGDAFQAQLATSDADADDFDGLVLPGGVANPDQLRMDDAAVALVRAFVDAGKPIAAICHAPWSLIEADVIRDRTLTSWPSLETDIRNAGAEWVDQEVVTCTVGPNTIITSRNPDDLPAFNEKVLDAFAPDD